MERSSSLSLVGIIPGDLHMKGSFYSLRNKVLLDFSSSRESSKNMKKIFYAGSKKAVRDCGINYRFAAVYEIQEIHILSFIKFTEILLL